MTGTDLADAVAAAISYPAALDDLHARVAFGRLVSSPTGVVVASLSALPDAPATHLARWGLAVATTGTPPEQAGELLLDEFATALLQLHHRLLHRALRRALEHLGGRTSGGASLLTRQLLQAQCGEIAMRLSEDRAVPEDVLRVDPQARWRRHQRLVETGRAILRLYGASGFLADGPAVDLHLAEVAGHVYLLPAAEESDD
jgi:hypothetical protein